MADNSSRPKMTFREKVARVYGRGSDEVATVNPSIEVDRNFTVKFSDEERVALDNERARIRERLTGSRR
jgi:hypothetical protein